MDPQRLQELRRKQLLYLNGFLLVAMPALWVVLRLRLALPFLAVLWAAFLTAWFRQRLQGKPGFFIQPAFARELAAYEDQFRKRKAAAYTTPTWQWVILAVVSLQILRAQVNDFASLGFGVLAGIFVVFIVVIDAALVSSHRAIDRKIEELQGQNTPT